MTAERTPEQFQRWQRHLARKGLELYGSLSDVLAGKHITLATLQLPHEQKTGERKEERLRRYLDQVVRAQGRLGTQGWGRCVHCQQPLPDAVLDELPWTETCHACADR